jgi:hypothetical protein
VINLPDHFMGLDLAGRGTLYFDGKPKLPGFAVKL